MKFTIPDEIKSIIGDREYRIDEYGLSNSTVMMFDDMVLKIEKKCHQSNNEHRILKWLDGNLPAPEIICSMSEDDTNYLLMSKLDGKMLCDKGYLDNPELLTTILANGLKLLWNVDITECQNANYLSFILRVAELRVENNLVDINNFEPTTLSENGFKDVYDLLKWLKNNAPDEELVFSHGDYCLPNVFAKDDKITGFIDFGRSRIADKWNDIALCYRSLEHNYRGDFGYASHNDYNSDMLFEKLGIKPQWDKIKYYILLDELF